MQKIYTTGYGGKNIADLKPMLDALDAVLVDIRFVPHSDILHWRKTYLKVLLDWKYLHIPNLGNRTFKEEKITIQNLTTWNRNGFEFETKRRFNVRL